MNANTTPPPEGLAPASGSVISDAALDKCVAGVPHNWGKWKVTQKLICTNWGTVSLIQDRQCSICGLTQSNRQTV